MEQAFLWLVNEFGEENIRAKKPLEPNPNDFPIKYDGSNTSLTQTAEIVARQMDIDTTMIHLETYKESIHEIYSAYGSRIFTQLDKDSGDRFAAGIFFDKNENGKFDIFVEEKNLYDPQRLVAILAHEFSHVKLQGEKRLVENDEYLVDLTTIIFGLGIFNANSVYEFHKSFDSWGIKSLGYLNPREWAFGLALFAYFREGKKSKMVALSFK